MNGRIDWARSRRRIFVQDRSIDRFHSNFCFTILSLFVTIASVRGGGIGNFVSYQKNPTNGGLRIVNSDSFSIFPRSAGGYRWLKEVDTAGRDKKNSVK